MRPVDQFPINVPQVPLGVNDRVASMGTVFALSFWDDADVAVRLHPQLPPSRYTPVHLPRPRASDELDHGLVLHAADGRFALFRRTQSARDYIEADFAGVPLGWHGTLVSLTTPRVEDFRVLHLDLAVLLLEADNQIQRQRDPDLFNDPLDLTQPYFLPREYPSWLLPDVAALRGEVQVALGERAEPVWAAVAQTKRILDRDYADIRLMGEQNQRRLQAWTVRTPLPTADSDATDSSRGGALGAQALLTAARSRLTGGGRHRGGPAARPPGG